MNPFLTPPPGIETETGKVLCLRLKRHEGHFSDVRPDKIGQTDRSLLHLQVIYGVWNMHALI